MPMRKARNLPPEVRTTIWRDVQETPLHYAVSVREIISQVRRLVPNCSATDEELSSLIGALATAAGRSVHFDSNDTPTKSDPSRRVG